jgi:hypothetical protein
MATLLDDQSVVQRVLDHIDKQTSDLGDQVWREPVENYLSHERFAAEMELLRSYPIAFCPSAALPRERLLHRTRCGQHFDTRCAGERQRRARISECVPPSRHAARRWERLQEGFCVPLPWMDLRPRRPPSPRATRIRVPWSRPAYEGIGAIAHVREARAGLRQSE